VYKGVGISNGKVKGKIKFYSSAIGEKRKKGATNPKNELNRLDKARKEVLALVKESEKRAKKLLGREEAQIFEIHAMLLDDEDLNASIIEEIKSGKSAEEAIEKTRDDFVKMLSALDDEYLSARGSDIKDISNQLISALTGGVSEFDGSNNEEYILVAEDLTPSETVRLDGSKILGFVTFGGTP
jgi:phosphotransferase system enzyme I (PtsI)